MGIRVACRMWDAARDVDMKLSRARGEGDYQVKDSVRMQLTRTSTTAEARHDALSIHVGACPAQAAGEAVAEGRVGPSITRADAAGDEVGLGPDRLLAGLAFAVTRRFSKLAGRASADVHQA